MKIVVALASSSAQLSGVQRHAISLARCLISRQEVSVVDLIVAPWQVEMVYASLPRKHAKLHIHSATIRYNVVSRNEWYYNELPKCVRQLQADLIHLSHPVPLSRGRYHCPVVVTLHDLYPYDIPENFGFPKVWFNQLFLRNCLSESDAIACVSHDTKLRLSSRWHERYAHKATVIPNVVEASVHEAAISLRFGDGVALGQVQSQIQNRPFLLCVSQHRKNKNILLTLHVFRHLLRSGSLASSTCLLIVGIPGPETTAILRFVKQSRLTSNVLMVNGISEDELRWCYRNCQVLLAPSAIEGFGLPVAEATSIGCRIVCSDIGAFREIRSPHCRFVPLGSDAIESLSAAVLESLQHDVPSPVDLPELSSSSIANQYMQLYSSLLFPKRDARGPVETSPLQTRERRRYI